MIQVMNLEGNHSGPSGGIHEIRSIFQALWFPGKEPTNPGMVSTLQKPGLNANSRLLTPLLDNLEFCFREEERIGENLKARQLGLDPGALPGLV